MSAHVRPLQVLTSIRRFGVRIGVMNCARVALPTERARLRIGPEQSVVMRRSSNDWETFVEVFLDQTYSDDFLCLFGEAPHSDSVRSIVDIGANVGYSSLYLASRYANADVLAIEPDDRNFDLLVENTGGHDRIRPIKGALWPAHEPVFIADTAAPSNSFVVTGAPPSNHAAATPVQGLTMADIFDLVPDHRIDVLKIDIEGAERQVFEHGADKWLANVGLILIELHDWKQPGCTDAYHAALHPFEYAEFAGNGTIGTLIRGPRVAVDRVAVDRVAVDRVAVDRVAR
jgi:FkbM family methyltransferase